MDQLARIKSRLAEATVKLSESTTGAPLTSVPVSLSEASTCSTYVTTVHQTMEHLNPAHLKSNLIEPPILGLVEETPGFGIPAPAPELSHFFNCADSNAIDIINRGCCSNCLLICQFAGHLQSCCSKVLAAEKPVLAGRAAVTELLVAAEGLLASRHDDITGLPPDPQACELLLTNCFTLLKSIFCPGLLDPLVAADSASSVVDISAMAELETRATMAEARVVELTHQLDEFRQILMSAQISETYPPSASLHCLKDVISEPNYQHFQNHYQQNSSEICHTAVQTSTEVLSASKLIGLNERLHQILKELEGQRLQSQSRQLRQRQNQETVDEGIIDRPTSIIIGDQDRASTLRLSSLLQDAEELIDSCYLHTLTNKSVQDLREYPDSNDSASNTSFESNSVEALSCKVYGTDKSPLVTSQADASTPTKLVSSNY
ncbi:unnamed protein product [Protopolystoma xenopodis]|uniref:Uncharacterized protein n=1 Tax=Protopolystoma xenopodis TaxID=117903 RepID=A0A3S4ZX99_9PLAT|nr:unnamed protein product [Protopolystoma xenopodis]